MVKSVIDAVMNSNDSINGKKRKQKRSMKSNKKDLRNQSWSDLMGLITQHQNYMKFLEDCGNMTEDKKKEIISEIDEIFKIIGSRKSTNIDEDDAEDINDTDVSSD